MLHVGRFSLFNWIERKQLNRLSIPKECRDANLGLFGPRRAAPPLHTIIHHGLLLWHGVECLVGGADAHVVPGGGIKVGTRSHREYIHIFPHRGLGDTRNQANRAAMAAKGRSGRFERGVLHRFAQYQHNEGVCVGPPFFVFNFGHVLFARWIRVAVSN